MASVQIRAVKKQFGSTQIIRGVDIDIADGELVVLVGPSGCGKTSFLSSLNRLTDLIPGCEVGGANQARWNGYS